ncbi:hypothetical protein PMAYCL1PPCAC_20808, partial [Pristionchus mayeri]
VSLRSEGYIGTDDIHPSSTPVLSKGEGSSGCNGVPRGETPREVLESGATTRVSTTISNEMDVIMLDEDQPSSLTLPVDRSL